MKFYTLDFDCNTPTVQQVNVPTNTDYKVGIKVRRNGEIQNLSPESVKLYTGETITVEPTDFNADKELATSIDALVVALLPASISADLGGKTINTVVPEVSYDNGATWGEVYVTTEFDHYFFVMDKSQGNYYYARLGLKNPKSKWELLDGTKTGVVGTSDTITMPTNPQAFLNTNSGQWSITQFPCIFRLVIKYGGYSYPVYIEPDADKTNGYVTFTLSSDDSASYTSEKIDIEKGYDVNAEEYNISSNNTGANLTATLLSVDLGQYAGTEVFAKDMQIAFNNASQTVLTKNDLLSTLVHYWDVPDELQYGQYSLKPIVVKANGDSIYSIQRGATFNMYINDLGWDINKPAFLYNLPGSDKVEFRESFTIEEGDVLQMPNVAVRKGRTAGVMFKFTSGTPFSAKFDLNTNIFKSQQGDIAESINNASTAKLTGVYADGTEFDYNIVIA